MVRTSRCFDGISIQLGEHFHCNLHLANSFFAHRQPCSAGQSFGALSDLGAPRECGSKAHDPKGEGAAFFAAVS